MTKLVGNLQTYEMRLGSIRKGGKCKNLALKGIEKEIEDSESEDEDDDENKDLTFITDQIIKLLQFRKNDKGKLPRKSKSSKARMRNPSSNAMSAKVLVI